MRQIQRTGTMPPPSQFVIAFHDRSSIDLAGQINDFVERFAVKIDSQSITTSLGGVFFAMVVFSEQES